MTFIPWYSASHWAPPLPVLLRALKIDFEENTAPGLKLNKKTKVISDYFDLVN